MEKIFREARSEIQFERKTNINFPAHVHDDMELIYVRRGSCTAFCDGEKYLLTDNSLFLVGPCQVHRYIECARGDYMVLIVNPKRLLCYGETFSGVIPVSPLFSESNEEDRNLSALLEAALAEYLSWGYSGIIEGYLAAVFGKLLRLCPMKRAEPARDKSLRVLEYCLAHYRDTITATDVAAALGVSRSYVSHIFSGRFAIHFCDYINSLRLLEAASLLRDPAASVTDVALHVGFSNLRTFNRAFMKQYGMTPTAYRKS